MEFGQLFMNIYSIVYMQKHVSTYLIMCTYVNRVATHSYSYLFTLVCPDAAAAKSFAGHLFANIMGIMQE